MKSGVTDFLIETAGCGGLAGSWVGLPKLMRVARMSPIGEEVIHCPPFSPGHQLAADFLRPRHSLAESADDNLVATVLDENLAAPSKAVPLAYVGRQAQSARRGYLSSCGHNALSFCQICNTRQ